jgi:predicted RNA-binding Zn-ribbon protein involved in translation (DUF1610 family)
MLAANNEVRMYCPRCGGVYIDLKTEKRGYHFVTQGKCARCGKAGPIFVSGQLVREPKERWTK